MKIPLSVDNVDGDACHISVNAVFNDFKNGVLLIDTGASKTVLDKDLTKDLIQLIDTNSYIEENPQTLTEKLSSEQREQFDIDDDGIVSLGVNSGKIDFHFGILKKLSLGNFTIENFTVALIDLSNINDLYGAIGKPKIWGLLGGDFLLKYKAVIDYNKKNLSIDENEF